MTHPSPSLAPVKGFQVMTLVWTPPLISSTSSALNSRAPIRVNTRLLSFMLFLLSWIGARCGPQSPVKVLADCGAYHWPHSPGSPSYLLGAITEHLVSVWIPPFTCSISWSVRSRAPWRANTLFWYFIVILLSGPRALKRPCEPP